MLVETATVPGEFFEKFDYFWVLVDGRVEKKIREYSGNIHADLWGESVWQNSKRGYYSQDMGIVYCHVTLTKSDQAKLEKAFPEAMYIKMF